MERQRVSIVLAQLAVADEAIGDRSGAIAWAERRLEALPHDEAAAPAVPATRPIGLGLLGIGLVLHYAMGWHRAPATESSPSAP